MTPNTTTSSIENGAQITPQSSKINTLKERYNSNVHYIICVDPTDTDNIELAIATLNKFGEDAVSLILTGRRALRPEYIKHKLANKSEDQSAMDVLPMSDWDSKYSEELLQESGQRFYATLAHYGYNKTNIYHGGISAKVGVPHHIHLDDSNKAFSLDKTNLNTGKNLLNLNTLEKNISQDNTVFLLGGPATGARLALETNEGLINKTIGAFAQFATLGKVQNMKWEGRSPAQFNVMLDAKSAESFLNKLQEHNIPAFFTPTEVTRVQEIGFGTQKMLEGILNTDIGNLFLAYQRKYYTGKAITGRKGEQILTHDMATLLLLLQVVGESKEIYKTKPYEIESIETGDTDTGVITFQEEASSESNLIIAEEMVDRHEYVKYLQHLLRKDTDLSENDRVFLSTSISSKDAENPKILLKYYDILWKKIRRDLDEGRTIVWGSHPSIANFMKMITYLYPGQVEQHLLEQFSDSQIVDDNMTHLHPDIHSLRNSAINGVSKALFIAGIDDLKETFHGFSGIQQEYVIHRLKNPDAEYELSNEVPGMSAKLNAYELAQQQMFLEYFVQKVLNPKNHQFLKEIIN